MEAETTNQMENLRAQMYTAQYSDTQALPEFSLIPDELLKKEEPVGEYRGKARCAIIGAILGAAALVSWVVILFGFLYSMFGIVFSLIGLKSSRQKYARLGLGLSLVSLLFTSLYAFAVYKGMINYNYFTTEFWGM